MLNNLETKQTTNFAGFLASRDQSANTVKGYVQDLNKFSSWFELTNGEKLTPQTLTPTDARLYRQHLLTVRKASPATINRHLAALRAFGRAAVDAGELDSNPLADLRGISEQKTAPKWLDRREQAAILRESERNLAAAKSEAGKRQAIRDQCVIILLLNTGLRISELTALDRDDLELSERAGSLRVRNGKGCKARTIPLNATVRKALRAWLYSRCDHNESSVFLGKRGERLAPSGIQRRIAELGRRVKVEVTPHTLRHTFAKNLVDAGVSLEKVAMLLGHSSLNTTKIYITPSRADLDLAVGCLDN